jgi:hypothetical protein
MRQLARLAAVLAPLGVVASVAVSPGADALAATAPPKGVAIASCNNAFLVRPATLGTQCSAGNVYFKGLKWSSWGGAKSVASGTIYYKVCRTTKACATAKYSRAKATLTVSVPKTVSGHRVYSQLVAKYTSGGRPQQYAFGLYL